MAQGSLDEGSHRDHSKFFIDLWHIPLFLHRGPGDKPICLKDTYIIPEYIINDTIKSNLADELEHFFLSKQWEQPILIFGQAGMGKSSLVAYLCDKYPSFIYLRFYNLDTDIIKREGVMSAVLDELEVKTKKYLRNQIIVLDGYDEVTLQNKNQVLLDFLLKCDKICDLKVIITLRENYINEVQYRDYRILKLQYFDLKKMHQFSEIFDYEIGTVDKNSIKVLGIPLILYMIASLNINMSESNGFCELYSKLFSLDYDKNIYQRVYMKGKHPTAVDKEKIHFIALHIAFEMFKKNTLEQSDYKELIAKLYPGDDYIKDEFLIGIFTQKRILVFHLFISPFMNILLLNT